MQYWSRFEELLAVHVADHGEVPAANAAERGDRRVGRIAAAER